MVRAFIIQHIDAIITTVIGIGFFISSFRKRKAASSNWFMANSRQLSILLIAYGGLRFGLDSAPTYSWRRVSIHDGHASAEFPLSPTKEEAIDRTGTLSLHRFTMNCNVPSKDINLRLSSNQIPTQGLDLTMAQRLDGMVEMLEQQGFSVATITNESAGDVPTFRIIAEKKGDEVRMVMRVAIENQSLYRVVATSTREFHNDPVIAQFVNSFQIRRKQ